jgi:hypothetical protein
MSTCGECVYWISKHTPAYTDAGYCSATMMVGRRSRTCTADTCLGFRTPAQARLENAAPTMLAALKHWCAECNDGPVPCVEPECDVYAAIRAAKEE